MTIGHNHMAASMIHGSMATSMATHAPIARTDRAAAATDDIPVTIAMTIILATAALALSLWLIKHTIRIGRRGSRDLYRLQRLDLPQEAQAIHSRSGSYGDDGFPNTSNIVEVVVGTYQHTTYQIISHGGQRLQRVLSLCAIDSVLQRRHSQSAPVPINVV